MKIYDLLWKKSETNGKARWEKVGALIEKDGKKSIKLDLMPVSITWDGWLVVSERREREGTERQSSFSSELEPF